MGHGTSSLLVPTSGSSTQAELVGIAPGSGFQDLKVRTMTCSFMEAFGAPISRGTQTGIVGEFFDTRAFTGSAGSGGGFQFAGYTSASGNGNSTAFAGISGIKENAVDADCLGALSFFTQSSAIGGGQTERWRITSSGHLYGRSDVAVGWTSGVAGSTADAGLSRIAAGVIGAGNGSAGDASGTLRAAALQAAAAANLTLGANAGTQMTFTSGGGVQVGSPTGGDKGAGTINATALYVNGTAVLTSTSTPTLAQVITAGNSTPGGGGTTTPLLINTGDIIKFNNTSGTTTANCIAFGTSAYLYLNTSTSFVIDTGSVPVKFTAAQFTGAGTTGVGGNNNPAGTPGSIYTWLKVITNDGSTGYVPVWK